MLASEIQEFDVVKLNDGREGTVVEIYRDRGSRSPVGYEVELIGTKMELQTVDPGQVVRVVWRHTPGSA